VRNHAKAASAGSTRQPAGTGAPVALFAALLACVALMLVVAAPRAHAATADTTYGYLNTFGVTYDGDADGNPDLVWEIGQNDAIAVDPTTGNIIVTYSSKRLLQVYAPDAVAGGTPLTTVDLSSLEINPVNVAVDPSNGDIYVVNSLGLASPGGAISKLVSDGAPVPSYTVDPSFYISPALFSNFVGGIAVDPRNHEVVLSDPPAHQVFRFSPSGSVITSFNGSDTALGTLANPLSVAIASDGTIYVGDDGAGGNIGPRVEQFSPAGESLGALPLTAGFRPTGVDVDLETGLVAVVADSRGETYLQGFDPSRTQQFLTHMVSASVAADRMGLAVDEGSDHIYVAMSTGQVSTFGLGQIRPGVDAPEISQVTPTSAHFASAVDPGGRETTAWIEYCPAAANAAAIEAKRCNENPYSDPSNPENPWIRTAEEQNFNEETTLEGPVTGLTPASSYLVRTYAGNDRADNLSSITLFTTAAAPPVVETGDVTDLSESGATLVGTIDAEGSQTSYHFEYGTTTSYGSREPVNGDAAAGAERKPHTFSRSISGLQPGTTYHYRLVASNAGGLTAGVDRTFTTVASGQSPPQRGYEQVSPVDKEGANVNGVIGYQASPDGSAIVIPASSASSDGESAPQIPRFLSRRGATDWLHWQPVDPPMNLGRGLINQTVMAVSEDFEHALVTSNEVLAPGGIDSGANVYIRDLRTGEYKLVAATARASAFLTYAGPNQANKYIAGAPDFSWVVLISQVPLAPGVTKTAMYKWSEGEGLTVESRLPDDSIPSGAAWQQTTENGETRLVSADGNTMYFALTSGELGVYRRSGGVSEAISVSHMGGPATPQPGRVDGISRDGRYAFFHSVQLTEDAQPGPNNLYRFDSNDESLEFIGTLAPWGSSQDGTTRVFAVAPDGRTVYFNSEGQLVVWREGFGVQPVSSQPVGGKVSPNGRYFGYQKVEEDGSRTVQLFDSVSEESVCVSCSPSGSAPLGDPDFFAEPLGEGSGRQMSNRIPQAVTDDGQIVFDTPQRLLGSDRNSARDVYSYKDGVTTLISPGDSNYDADFVDMSADANDIYFVTGESLVPQDVDGGVDVYDARVGGGFASQTPLPPLSNCAGSECASSPAGPTGGPPIGSRPTGTPKGRISIISVSLGKKGLRITMQATQAGRLTISSNRTRKAVRRIGKGTHSISVPLTKKARELLRVNEKLKVSLRLGLEGDWGSASAKSTRTLGK
jgi:hypothetical protein